MSVAPNVVGKKRRKSESKPQSQLNKCLNEKRRREQENVYIEELAELISASTSDMSSLSIKPDKCAILQETVNQIRRIKQESGESNELQQSEVSSSKPTILANHVLGPLLLEALDGFSLTVNTDGKIEFVSDNISSFLKYRQDDLVDKSIYNIIHIGDHARFSSNLLPMSIGNGFGWSSEPSTNKSRSFNCRFLVKSPDDQDGTMEEKQSHVSQYENMHVSALLLPFPREKSEGSEGEPEHPTRMLCVARRASHNEKSPTSVGVEQFTTRLDLTGKILTIDTSGVSSTYSQYLNKDLVGQIVQELCHPSDFPKLDHHLKETLQTGNHISSIYRFRIAQDRYVHVQTKSKRFSYNRSVNDQEFIAATHSIIRDADTLFGEGNGSEPKHGTPSPASSSAGGSGCGLSGNVNGNMSGQLSMVSTIPPTNSTFTFPSLSPPSSDFTSLNEFVTLDVFPTSSWGLDSSDSGLNTSLSTTALGGSAYLVSSNPPTPTSSSITNANSTSGALRISQSSLPSSSAFSPDMMSSKESPATQLSSTSSPIAGHVPQCSSAFAFSTGQTQPSSDRISPNVASALKKEDIATTEVPVSSPATSVSGLIADVHVSSNETHKLRNLLIQGTEEADSSASKGSTSERNGTQTHKLLEHEANNVMKSISDNVSTSVSTSRKENIILRELLTQDDEDIVPVEIPGRTSQRLIENESILSTASESSPENHRRTINKNNMLIQLLNSDDDDKGYRTPQELLIQQILDPNSPGKNESSNCIGETDIPRGRQSTDAFLKQLGMEHNQHPSTSSHSSSLTDVMGPVAKRKSPDEAADNCVDSVPKRVNVNSGHANMAVQNPMLASMLAQTPNTAPSVPTSIANSIVSQLPQERLPKNLEKKLIHTPYTSAGPSTSNSTSPNTTGAQFYYSTNPQNTNRSLPITSLQQEVVTPDSRAHITLNPPPSLSPISMPSSVTFQTQQPGVLSKILSGPTGTEANPLYRGTVSSTTAIVSAAANLASHQSTGNYNHFSQTAANLGLNDVEGASNIIASNHSDPLLSDILDQVWSMQEEMNIEPSSSDDPTLMKFLEVIQPPVPAAPLTPEQDLNEKLAINAIQQELMSFAVPPGSVATAIPAPAGQLTSSMLSSPGTTQSGPISTVAMSPSALSPNSFPTTSHYPSASQPPAYGSTVGPNPKHRMVAPVASNSQQVAIGIQRNQSVPPYATSVGAAVTPNMKRSLLERRRVYMHQQQRRLLAKQQQQLLMQTQQPLSETLSPASPTTFTENMNELINNTVAPNVALQQRPAAVPEPQLSPRYNTNMVGQLPSPIQQSTPSQLSPGQRVGQHPPYSPLSQQSFPSPTPAVSNYQQQPQHRLSPHPIPPYTQGHSPSPAHSPHLQLSPQPGTGQPQWTQRPAQNQSSNNLQQQNPMLNAQLSQQGAFAAQVRFPTQQRQMSMRSIPSPSSLNSSRNSPYPNQPDSPYPPPSPGGSINMFQQQRLQRVASMPGRVNSPRTIQGGFVSGEPLLSPQPQSSPGGYTQSLPVTPTSNYSSTTGMSSASMNYTLASEMPFGGFDQQIFTTNALERNRGSNGGMTSEYVRQELRAMVGARTQQQQQQQQQQQPAPQQQQQGQQGHHQLHLGAPTPPGSQSLSQDLEALGLSLELGPNDGQPASPAIYSQPLLSIASGTDGQNNSPRVKVEDVKPNDQKKSLLQQLLSEPP